MTPSGQLQIQELKLQAGQEWIDCSEAWRVVLLRKGAAYWLGTDKPRAITEGEVLAIVPGTHAVLRASQLGEALLAWFPFEPKLVCGVFTMAERRWFECAVERAPEPVQYLPSTHPVAKAFTALLERTSVVPEIVQRAEVLVIILQFLALNLPPQEPAASRAAAAHERFSQIIAQMPDTELIRRSSEELAALCGCTPRHFNRLFRAQFGQSPRVRQTELRLLKASSLLQYSDQTISHIAAECGYRSLSLFNSLFKRRFGFSPAEWRQRNATPSPVSPP